MALNGKTALVTGICGGMGSEIARYLALSGCTILGIDRYDAETVTDNIEKLTQICKKEVRYFECNLLKRESITDLCQKIDSAVPAGIDILVNNAGVVFLDLLENKTLEGFDEEITVNLTAPFHLSKHFFVSMKKKGWGRIVNISSAFGLVGSPKSTGYSAAKAGLIGLTRGIAVEAAQYGVTCNSICPCTVDTNRETCRSESYEKEYHNYSDC
ncbi:D-beta-hydroxybutyrate dehydrogenase-like [Saccostrea echinata]|uniref:D-beta-hydroxybutyrate dehydrogenase-like n=1 Tax=Saccostrea echinata TaxID=191078 RepID=UPI002A834F58|nr:D-beta-hydroxybutyrate dehydrogenase-like [Saccostrea echinata]